MTINPYLTFDGNCAEAMAFYQGILGGDLQVMKYGDMPDNSMVPDGMGDRIAHAGLDLGGVRLQASDSMGHMPFNGHCGFNLQLEPTSVDEGKALFDKLAEGGKVTMEYQETFWAKGFGLLNDKFGVPWMVNVM